MSGDVINTCESDNNNNRKSNVIITCNNYIEKRTRLIRSFNIPFDKVPVYEEFMRIVRREAGERGFSQVLIKAMEEYIARHAIPNPQATLDRILSTSLPAKPHDACCVPGCNRKAAYQLILQDYEGKREIFRVCQLHKEWRHNRFKFIVGFKEL